jgi:hypothetical protein
MWTAESILDSRLVTEMLNTWPVERIVYGRLFIVKVWSAVLVTKMSYGMEHHDFFGKTIYEYIKDNICEGDIVYMT